MGFMYLTVPAGSPLRGAELQSLTTPGYSYGYYEARIKITDVQGGGVVSFFWIEQPNYGSHEWDVEFTLSDFGQVQPTPAASRSQRIRSTTRSG